MKKKGKKGFLDILECILELFLVGGLLHQFSPQSVKGRGVFLTVLEW